MTIVSMRHHSSFVFTTSILADDYYSSFSPNRSLSAKISLSRARTSRNATTNGTKSKNDPNMLGNAIGT